MRLRRLPACVVFLGALVLSACGGEQASEPDGSGSSKGTGSRNAAPAGVSGSGEVGERILVSGGSFTRVSPTELRSMMREEDFALVNTHVPFEGKIPGTDLSIPYDEIGRNLDRLPDKQARIVLYCRSGSMSAEAAETLVGLGYEDLWDLRGGMIAWEDAGFRLEGA
jgi:rhodanese-related sulfurtransferase